MDKKIRANLLTLLTIFFVMVFSRVSAMPISFSSDGQVKNLPTETALYTEHHRDHLNLTSNGKVPPSECQDHNQKVATLCDHACASGVAILHSTSLTLDNTNEFVFRTHSTGLVLSRHQSLFRPPIR